MPSPETNSPFRVATALTVYGIETCYCCYCHCYYDTVATALTVYGIETQTEYEELFRIVSCRLQQPLPFTVLKLNPPPGLFYFISLVATALTVYGIETYFR